MALTAAWCPLGPRPAPIPMPSYLMAGHHLRRAVPAGTVIMAAMVEPPPDSVLWRLGREME